MVSKHFKTMTEMMTFAQAFRALREDPKHVFPLDIIVACIDTNHKSGVVEFMIEHNLQLGWRPTREQAYHLFTTTLTNPSCFCQCFAIPIVSLFGLPVNNQMIIDVIENNQLSLFITMCELSFQSVQYDLLSVREYMEGLGPIIDKSNLTPNQKKQFVLATVEHIIAINDADSMDE